MGKPLPAVFERSFQADQGALIKKTAAIFFPGNPYPFWAGNSKRFLEAAKALIQMGYETHLLSSDIISERLWDQESLQRVREIGISSISLCEVSALDRWLAKQSRKLRERFKIEVPFDSWDLNPPGLKFWTAKILKRLKPEIIWVHYAIWGGVLDLYSTSSSVTVIESQSLISSHFKLLEFLKIKIKNPLNGEIYDSAYWEKLTFKTDPREYRIYDRYHFTVAITLQEATQIQAHTKKTKVLYIPHAEPPVDHPNRYDGPALFTAGTHVFNLHGYLYFIKKILPLIQMKVPEFLLKVTGKPGEKMEKQQGIQLEGFVEDLDPFYQACRFAVFPILTGSGQPIKVMEALAHGVGIITTRFGAKNCPIKHGFNGFIAEGPEDFSEYAVRLWQDPGLCKELGENARQTAREFYSDSNYTKKIQPHLMVAKSRVSVSLR